MNFENLNPENTGKKVIELTDYNEGLIVKKNGEFYLAADASHDEARLVEKDGELYVAEGGFDPDLLILRKNTPEISSGY